MTLLELIRRHTWEIDKYPDRRLCYLRQLFLLLIPHTLITQLSACTTSFKFFSLDELYWGSTAVPKHVSIYRSLAEAIVIEPIIAITPILDFEYLSIF